MTAGEDLEDYLSCQIKFDQDKRITWLGQPHIFKKFRENFEKRIKEANRDDLKEAMDKTKAMKDSIDKVFDYMLGAEDKRQGITSTEFPSPYSFINTALFYTYSSRDPLSDRDNVVFKHAEVKTQEMLDKVNLFYQNQWPSYRSMIEKITLSPFKDYEPINKN